MPRPLRFPLFNPARALPDPANWQAFGSQPVFIHGNLRCNISSASHQLLAADSYCCPVSSLKRQEKDQSRNLSGRRAWLWWASSPKCGKNKAEHAISASAQREWKEPASTAPLNWTGFLNISAMSLTSYAAVCGGAIRSSAVVQQRRSFDSLLGRRERKTDLAVLRSLCPTGMLIVGFSFMDDTKWCPLIRKKRRNHKHEAAKHFYSIDKKKQTGLNMGDEVSRYASYTKQ